MRFNWAVWECCRSIQEEENQQKSKRRKKKMGANAPQPQLFLETSSLLSLQRVSPLDDSPADAVVLVGEVTDSDSDDSEDLSISFGYTCRNRLQDTANDEEVMNLSVKSRTSDSSSSLDEASPTATIKLLSKKSSSFSCLSGAALGANATLANTSLGKGLIGEEILPGLDSPRTFRKLVSSSSTPILELSGFSCEIPSSFLKIPSTCRPQQSWSAPNRMESVSFLTADDVQTAGGAAGEDRVQAVCSEENGWLYCGIYDGFNGRDAADYLAGTFYQNVGRHLRLLEWHVQREHQAKNTCAVEHSSPQRQRGTDAHHGLNNIDLNIPEAEEVNTTWGASNRQECSVDDYFEHGVMQGLERAFQQTEYEFLEMVEKEMEERPELVMVGSCVLAVLMHGQDLYTLNVGDSRAVLATTLPPENSIQYGRVGGGSLWAVQMTESHVVDSLCESSRVQAEHPDEQSVFVGGRLKGKLKVTRAFGAGYMKKAKLNDALMGIFRIKDLLSPPYLGVVPCVSAHRVSEEDSFVVLGSDGLFDFFTNEEVVGFVHDFVVEYPTGDPAKYMLDQLLRRAAENSGITLDQLKAIPIGRRRKYHDDVTVIVISLGAQFPTSKASTVSVPDEP